jgi:hypothetical protein
MMRPWSKARLVSVADAVRCVRCGKAQPVSSVNVEARIHHRGEVICYDRKACERRVRKAKKKRR